MQNELYLARGEVFSLESKIHRYKMTDETSKTQEDDLKNVELLIDHTIEMFDNARKTQMHQWVTNADLLILLDAVRSSFLILSRKLRDPLLPKS